MNIILYTIYSSKYLIKFRFYWVIKGLICRVIKKIIRKEYIMVNVVDNYKLVNVFVDNSEKTVKEGTLKLINSGEEEE